MLHLLHFDRCPGVDRVYMAMRSNDLSDCVVTALELLKKNKMLPFFYEHAKSTFKSLEHEAKGKKAFSEGNYQVAMMEYNIALQQAPTNSDIMRSIYFNRAEVFLKMNLFLVCLKDIELCLALDCPEKMVNELKKMKEEASKHSWIEKYLLEHEKTMTADDFFKLKGECNSDIPCASSDIKVIMESRKPKVVAARDIPVGTILALETSFINYSVLRNKPFECHYCKKLSLNLIPCDECIEVLFCDKNCRELSMREGHNIECKIIHLFTVEHYSRKLAILAVLKFRQMSKSWDELITASHNLGSQRTRNSSIADIFGADKFSLLNSDDDKHFIHGAMFYSSFYFAYIIHILDTRTSFLPSSPLEKIAAIRAISRIMMHLSLNSIGVPIAQCTRVVTRSQITFFEGQNSGFFPFISKLSHACLANTYVAGLGNGAALVTCTPIKQGAEITIPYLCHWLDSVKENDQRAFQICNYYGIICNCIICSGDEILGKQPLNDIQKKVFQKFKADEAVKKFPEEINLIYKKTCKTLALLSEVPYSKEYSEVFNIYVMCLMHYLDCKLQNTIL